MSPVAIGEMRILKMAQEKPVYGHVLVEIDAGQGVAGSGVIDGHDQGVRSSGLGGAWAKIGHAALQNSPLALFRLCCCQAIKWWLE